MTQLIVAIDTSDIQLAMDIAAEVKPYVSHFKLGHIFYSRAGMIGVEAFATQIHHPLMLDLKLVDIPNTVIHTLNELDHPQVEIVTVHHAGGPTMIEAAVKAAPTKIALITSLTSLQREKIPHPYLTPPYIVAPASEIEVIRQNGYRGQFIVPGVRRPTDPQNDHYLVSTPSFTRRVWADYAVVGRPITSSKDPASIAREFQLELQS